MCKKNQIWCVHNGETTYACNCPYTIKYNLTCSMPHLDQPNGKFDKDTK